MEDITIYTTNYPTEYITKRLYGEFSTIKSIYPDGVNINAYKLTDKQIEDYSKSNLFIFNGLSNEKDYVEPMREINKNLKIIDTTLSMEYNDSIEELWLDPSNFLMMAQNVKTGFNEYIDSYYLTNNFYKEYDRCGSLFMDYKSSFTDKNIVIYGHNIKRGIMFADLENVCNGSLGNDIDVNIYMPDKTMKFKVFSSYSIDPEDYSINTSITQNEFDEFKQTLSKRSKIDFVSDYNGSNQILTLSTCDRSGKRRVLVHAALEEVNYISNT